MGSRWVLVDTPDGPIPCLDDSLQVDAANLLLVKERFPDFCPFHVLHNLVGGHYSRAPQCSAEPFRDVTCEHGSHSRPVYNWNDAQEYRWDCPALGAVTFLPFGLSFRAGIPGSLTVGCVACASFGYSMACAACLRRFDDDGPPDPASAYAIWNTLHHHTPSCECGACPVEEVEGYGAQGWADGEEWDGAEGEWEDEEEWDGGEDWHDEEEDDGEAEGDGEAEWGGEEEEEAEPGEEAGAEEPAGWGSGYWERTAQGYAWVVDYRSHESAPAPAVEADGAASVVEAAVQAAVAAVAAAAASSSAGERPAATDADWQRRVRVLELEHELAGLRAPKRARH